MSKRWKFFWLTVLTLCGLIFAFPLILNNTDLNQFKPEIESVVLDATGRSLSIEGDLQFKLSRHPLLSVEKVSFDNAEWSDKQQMVTLDHLMLQIDLMALLKKRLVIEQLVLRGLVLNIEKRNETEANWRMKGIDSEEAQEPREKDRAGAPLRPVLKLITIDDVTINYNDDTADINTQIDLEELKVSNHAINEPFHFQSNGSVNQHPFSINGESDFLDASELDDISETISKNALSLKVDARSLNATLTIDGIIKQPALARGIDFDVTLKVSDLNKVVSTIIGRPIHSLPVRSTQPLPLDLTTQLSNLSGDIKLQNIKLKLADSDLSGDLLLSNAGSKPRIYATLRSELVDIDRVLPTQKATTARQQAVSKQKFELPDTPIALDFLDSIDSKIDYRVHKLIFKGTRLEDISLNAELKNARLEVTKLDLMFDGTPIQSQIALHENARQVAIESQLKIAQLKLKTIAGMFDLSHLKRGMLNSDIALTSHGDNVRSLVFNLEGNATIDFLDIDARVSANDNNYAITVDTATLNFSAINQPVRYNLDGSINKQPLALNGSIDTLESLLKSQPVKLKSHITTLAAEIDLDSEIDKLFDKTTVQSDLSVSIADPNDSIKRLASLIPDAKLPGKILELPVDLNTSIDFSGSTLRARKLRLHVGSNDINGELSLDLSKAKPYLEAELSSKQIDMESLLAHLRDDDTKKSETEPSTNIDGKMFSHEPLPSLDGLDALNTELTLSIDRLSANQQSIEDLSVNLTLIDGRLQLKPLQLKFSEGTIKSTLILQKKQSTHLELDTTVTQLDYGRLMQMLDVKEYARGNLDANIFLRSDGNTESELMAALDGQVRVTTEGGTLDSQSLKFLSKDLSSLIPFTDNSNKQKIRCAVVQFDINRGIADTHSMVIDTGTVSALGTGQINLANETLSLYVAPRSKRTSVLKLALVPVNITGSFSSPSIVPDAAGATMRTTNTAAHISLAIMTSGVSLVAEPLTDKLWEQFIDDTDYCALALSGEKVVPTLIKLQNEIEQTATDAVEPDAEDPDYIEELDDDEGGF